ncbi:MAG: hypothetical protein ABR499_02750 [Gemmatimonadaceae bacterium]
MTRRALASAPVLAAIAVVAACQDATRPAPEERPAGGSLAATEMPGEGATRCEGVFTGASFDHVYVPPRASCSLYNSVVRGNVIALPGSSLFLRDDQVGGDVIGVRAADVQMIRGSVGGNVRIEGSADPSAVAGVQSTHLAAGSISIEGVAGGTVYVSFVRLDNGGVRVERNTAGWLFVEHNTAAGDMEVSRNSGPGIKYAYRNTLRGTLRCLDNDLPFVGGPNAAGRIEGQCF